jgi:hypothetical protein
MSWGKKVAEAGKSWAIGWLRFQPFRLDPTVDGAGFVVCWLKLMRS